MANLTDLDSIGRLIDATKKYIADLEDCKKTIHDACEAFKFAMGNDDLSKKRLSELQTTFRILNQIQQEADAILQAQNQNRDQIIDIVT